MLETLQIVDSLLELVLKLVSFETATARLSAKEIDRANQTADAIELAKFGKISSQN